MTKQAVKKEDYPEIERMYRAGMTYREIGEAFGVTRQYIGLIASGMGMNKSDGGAAKILEDKKKKARENLDEKYMGVYGCTYDEYKEYRDYQRQHPLNAFMTQRANAKARGIDWNFTYSDWWGLWKKSGVWHLRGRGAKRYCMARFGDSGPYEIGNVEIVTNSKNIKEVRARESAAKNLVGA